MSLEDSPKKRVVMCRREYDILYKQLAVLLEKMDILFPTRKKMESSEPKSDVLVITYTMSLKDSSKKRVAKCRREYDILYKQLPVLLQKMDILFPTGKTMESSEPENKSETNKVVAPLPAVTPEEIGEERYKDLEESIRGFIKELDEAEKETGGTSQAATLPSVEDE